MRPEVDGNGRPVNVLCRLRLWRCIWSARGSNWSATGAYPCQFNGYAGKYCDHVECRCFSFSAARFLSGMATDSNFVMMYILVLEYLRESSRTFGLNLCIGVFYCLGSLATPLIALKLGEWRLFLEVTAIPLLVVPSFWFLLPESIHWLVATNKPERALTMFHRVAKFNGKALPDTFDGEFKQSIGELSKVQVEETRENLWGLFKTPRLRKNILILFFKS